MIDDEDDRLKIAGTFGDAIDELVAAHTSGRTHEPPITARIGATLEALFNGHQRGGYKIRIITADITASGGKSLEKRMGSDLYLMFEVEDGHGQTTSKGVFVQAKKAGNSRGLVKQCQRMNVISKKGSVVWTYTSAGVRCERAVDAENKLGITFDSHRFFDRVLKCEIGDRRRVPAGHFGDRAALTDMLETIGARDGVGIQLRKVKP